MAEKKLLEGVRILTLEQVMVLPYGTSFLADLGAEVIRVESPEHFNDRRMGMYPDNKQGEEWWNESAAFTNWNRNKKSLCLDVYAPKGRELFLELVKHSDVVCDNFRYGAMQRLGFDYDSLAKINPNIISFTCNAYGSTGPYKTLGARARNVDSFCGLSYISGYEGNPSLRVSSNYMDHTGALSNAFLLLNAIYYKQRTGKGLRVDASMYEAGVQCIAPALAEVQRGIFDTRHGSADRSWRAPYNVYPCQPQDRWIAICVTTDEQWERLREVMGKPDWAMDAKYDTVNGRWEGRSELDALLGSWTMEHDYKDLTLLLQKYGIPAGGVMDAEDVVEDPHLNARDYFDVFPPEKAKTVGGRAIAGRKFTGRPFRMPFVPMPIGPTADFGSNNRELIQGVLGVSDVEYAALEADGIIRSIPTPKELANKPPANRIGGF